MIDKQIFCDRILQMSPEIGDYGNELTVADNKPQITWIFVLNKDSHAFVSSKILLQKPARLVIRMIYRDKKFPS